MHPNETILRDSDQAMLDGDVEAFMGFFTDDIVVHMGGGSSLAGTFKGKDQFMDVFERFMKMAGDYSFEAHAYLADDEHGVILQTSNFSKGGKTLTTNDTFVCHFIGGRISEMWMMTDDQTGLDSFLEG